ncbi:MAG: NUDIX domain-containing protein [Anaerolineales bacterium]|nr:NUDIX domain-containing protein [Anaerolineales bacterium]
MRISTNGIIVNGQNRVLLIQRSDSRTFAPPGGGLEFGELPPDGAAREVLEETGLVVAADKLVSVFYWPNEPYPFLTFSFRCRVLGGELIPSRESPRVGYYPIVPLPRLVLPFHRKRVQIGLAYTAGAPYWGVQHMTWYEDLGKRFLGQVAFRWYRLLRRLRGQSAYAGRMPGWVLGAFVVIWNDAGAILWVKRTDVDLWNLPGGGANQDEPPWETAVRETFEETGLHVRLTDLSGVYAYQDMPHLIFVFTAVIEHGQLTTGPESAAFAYFAVGAEPDNVVQQHVARAADACLPRDRTLFRFQSSKTAVTVSAED